MFVGSASSQAPESVHACMQACVAQAKRQPNAQGDCIVNFTCFMPCELHVGIRLGVLGDLNGSIVNPSCFDFCCFGQPSAARANSLHTIII